MVPNRLATLCVALACGWIAAPAGVAAPLEFIGQQILPTGFIPTGPAGAIGGTPVPVGGLSGIDFDAATGRYLAISDDRAQLGPARFYDLSLDLAAFRTGTTGGVSFNAVTALLRPDGTPFPPLTVDPEALRLRGGKVFWTSEGEANFAAGRIDSPFVRSASLDGTHSTQFGVPSQYAPIFSVGGPQASGIRNNLAFESLSFDASGNRLYTATENALFQDGPPATVTSGSPSRVLAFDAGTGAAVAEYVYNTEAVALPPSPAGGFATNGLVELLAVSDTQFLALERSFAVGAAGTPGNTGNTIRLFLASIEGASNVLGTDSLAGQFYTPMSKTLLLDLTDLGIPMDNVEGMTFGPSFEGRPTLILVSDNNFSATQFTQFVAFSVTGPIPEPSTYALMAGGLVLAAASVRRRGKR